MMFSLLLSLLWRGSLARIAADQLDFVVAEDRSVLLLCSLDMKKMVATQLHQIGRSRDDKIGEDARREDRRRRLG